MNRRVIVGIVSILTTGVLGFDSTDTFIVGEVRGSLRSKTVSPTKSLGASCQEDGECLTAFAACTRRICRCRPGFQPDAQSRCSSQRLSCPSGEPLTQGNGREIVCSVTFDNVGGALPVPSPIGRKRRQATTSGMTDSCPGDSFCLLHGATFSKYQEGHCCPKPKSECPIGQPETRYSCNPETPERSTYCPQETHYCTSFGENWGLSSKLQGVCCPKPCPSGLILKNGVCYGPEDIGEACEVDEQCQQISQSMCVNGRCACARGTTRNGRFCETPYCPRDASGPVQRLTTAIQNIDGSYMKCQGSDIDCGANAVCYNSYCCEKPEPFCPNAQGLIVRTPQYCNPFDPREIEGGIKSSCPPGEFCVEYLYGPQNMRGICCTRRPDLTRLPIGK